MKISDIITTSLLNLVRQKVRILLTIFSIVVGAMLITLMVSIGNGLSDFIQAQVSAFSTPVTISVNVTQGGGEFIQMLGFGAEPQEYEEETQQTAGIGPQEFTPEQIESIEKIEHVEKVVQLVSFNIDYIQLEGDEEKYEAFALHMPEFQTSNIALSAGEMIVDDGNDQIIIPQQFAEKWGYANNLDDLIGEKIIVHASQSKTPGFFSLGAKPLEEGQLPQSKDFELTLVGISEKSLASTLVLISKNKAVEIARFVKNNPNIYSDNTDGIYEISVKADSENNVKYVDEKIEELGFYSSTYDDILGQLGTIFNIVNLVLSTFGIIALAVAALGIINTMLMATYERTREIGIMKAVGARKKDISILFTFEASLIGFFGGLIGITAGAGLGQFANWVLHEYFFLADYPALNISIVTLPLVITIITLTTIVALISGLYPAYRASRLDPIDALRYE